MGVHSLKFPSETCLELLLILGLSTTSLPPSLQCMNSFQVRNSFCFSIKALLLEEERSLGAKNPFKGFVFCSYMTLHYIKMQIKVENATGFLKSSLHFKVMKFKEISSNLGCSSQNHYKNLVGLKKYPQQKNKDFQWQKHSSVCYFGSFQQSQKFSKGNIVTDMLNCDFNFFCNVVGEYDFYKCNRDN